MGAAAAVGPLRARHPGSLRVAVQWTRTEALPTHRGHCPPRTLRDALADSLMPAEAQPSFQEPPGLLVWDAAPCGFHSPKRLQGLCEASGHHSHPGQACWTRTPRRRATPTHFLVKLGLEPSPVRLGQFSALSAFQQLPDLPDVFQMPGK